MLTLLVILGGRGRLTIQGLAKTNRIKKIYKIVVTLLERY